MISIAPPTVAMPSAVTPSARQATEAPRSDTTESSTRRDEINGLTQEELKLVRKLAARDREVRAHEQAHASVGGQYAGSPTYTYERGPDGRNYAVGGEVPIDTAPVPGDPEATIAKARVVRRAALAPAQPSPQDRAVAAEATAIEQQARAELLAGETSSQEDGSASENRSFRLADYQPIDTRA